MRARAFLFFLGGVLGAIFAAAYYERKDMDTKLRQSAGSSIAEQRRKSRG